MLIFNFKENFLRKAKSAGSSLWQHLSKEDEMTIEVKQTLKNFQKLQHAYFLKFQNESRKVCSSQKSAQLQSNKVKSDFLFSGTSNQGQKSGIQQIPGYF